MPLIKIDEHVALEDLNPSISVQPKSEESLEVAKLVEPTGLHDGSHRWDPGATWTAKEENAVVRRTDALLLLALCAIYLCMQLDRGNVANAVTDNFLSDINLTQTHLNHGIMIQRIVFLLTELPSQYFIVRYGFRQICPWMVMGWGIIGTSTSQSRLLPLINLQLAHKHGCGTPQDFL